MSNVEFEFQLVGIDFDWIYVVSYDYLRALSVIGNNSLIAFPIFNLKVNSPDIRYIKGKFHHGKHILIPDEHKELNKFQFLLGYKELTEICKYDLVEPVKRYLLLWNAIILQNFLPAITIHIVEFNWCYNVPCIWYRNQFIDDYLTRDPIGWVFQSRYELK